MGILDWLTGRTAPMPPSLNKPERGPQRDPDEGITFIDADGDGLPDIVEGIALGLEYADVVGEISTRRVIARKLYEREGFLYLQGFCLLRRDDRTFRADRILELTLPPRWTKMPDPVSFLRSYLPPRPEARHEIAERSYPLKVAARDGLVLLTYVARCDGAFAPNEMAEVRNYLIDLAEAGGFQHDEAVLDEVLRYVANLFPAPRTLSGAIKRLENSDGALDILLPRVELLVKADGIYSDAEKQAIATIATATRQIRDKRAASAEKAKKREVRTKPTASTPGT